MSNDNNTLQMIAHCVVEVTFRDELTEQEIFGIITMAEREGIDAVCNQNGRIMTFECDDYADAIVLITDNNLAEEIGLIKIITELEPQWELEEIY